MFLELKRYNLLILLHCFSYSLLLLANSYQLAQSLLFESSEKNMKVRWITKGGR